MRIEEPHRGLVRRVYTGAAIFAAVVGIVRMVSELVRPSVVAFLDALVRDSDQSRRIEEIAVATRACSRENASGAPTSRAPPSGT